MSTEPALFSDEARIIQGRNHGVIWARHLATAAELVRADRLFECAFPFGVLSEWSVDPALHFVQAIRPGFIGAIGPVEEFRKEIEELSEFPSNPQYVAAFCMGASLTWKAGHFLEELLLAGRKQSTLAESGHPIPELFEE